ncbi:hypothetical protein MBOU_34420 [Mycobacterium bourgelatii]|uniref:ParB/Sulfiredoxin domain-containing protein n=1 Tax=Mycobacterium bourgelatii TaxID=1273442 RepID=A0A7I9YRT8_MYCBU|nr:hypothetical protein MBOU_34420 [Mycobacterium bourgelatii]
MNLNDNEKSIDATGHRDEVASTVPAVSGEAKYAPEGYVRSENYGMHYDPGNYLVVERARRLPDKKWNKLPVETLPCGTSFQASLEILEAKTIDKVTSGKEELRENYEISLWRDENGQLYVVNGHYRVAMHYALGKEMHVRIMDETDYDRLMRQGWWTCRWNIFAWCREAFGCAKGD